MQRTDMVHVRTAMSGSGQAGQRPAASYEPLGLIDTADRERFTSSPPAGADFIALGERWEAELEAPEVPPEYGKRVLGAYQNGRLSASRTVELLWGTVAIEELPEQRPVALESLRRDFEPLS